MKTKSIVITVVVVLAVVIGYKLYDNKKEINAEANQKEPDFAIPVKVDTVKEKTLSDALVATGEFQGWEEVTLVAESQGAISNLAVEEGGTIRKGTAIAQIDAVSLNSQLTSAQSTLAKAKKDVARYKKLEKAGAVSQTQLEDAQIRVENAESNIAQIQQQLSFTAVKSPIDGVVNSLMVEESSFVMPGDEIAEVVQIDRLKIVVNVSESDLSQIKEGQNVKLTTDVFPLKEFSGKVKSISVKADESKKFKITIAVENTEKKQLRSGMFVSVHFDALSEQKTTALVIPREAIINSLQNPSVYVAKDSIATIKTIEVGKKVNGHVIVLSGLSKGDLVVTKGIINLVDGTKINITK